MSGTENVSNGVTPYRLKTIDIQGQLYNTGIETNIAIDGSGMFAVASDIKDDEVFFTRLGSFASDQEGYLVNGERAYSRVGSWIRVAKKVMCQYPPSIDSLENINLSSVGGDR